MANVTTSFKGFNVITYNNGFTNDTNSVGADGLFATATPTTFAEIDLEITGSLWSGSAILSLPTSTNAAAVATITTSGVDNNGAPLTIDKIYSNELWLITNSDLNQEIDYSFDTSGNPFPIPDGSIITQLDIQLTHKWDGTTYSIDNVAWRVTYTPPPGGTSNMLMMFM